MNNLFDRKILIADADESVTLPLLGHLERLGNVCRAEKTIKACRDALSREHFDAVISELFLADGKATDLLGGEGLPPLFICSAEAEDEDIVEALSLGAADYILKPCSPRVIAARVGARLPPRNRSFSYGGLTLDMGSRTASYLGQPVKLTSSELNILCFLMTYPGKFFPADVIYEKVWNASSMQTSVVRFHISNLKKALYSVTGKNLILSEFGTGYAFASD